MTGGDVVLFPTRARDEVVFGVESPVAYSNLGGTPKPRGTGGAPENWIRPASWGGIHPADAGMAGGKRLEP